MSMESGSAKYDKKLIQLDASTSQGKILEQIQTHSQVLECGCATGYMTRWMSEKLDCQVSIIEMDENCYRQARIYATDGYCGDLMQDGWFEHYQGQKFDYVLFADVLEHLTDPMFALKRAVALLKDNGKIVISIPNIAHNDVILKLCFNHFDYTSTGLLDNTHVHFWGRENLEALCEEADLGMVLLDGVIMPTGTTEQSLGLRQKTDPVLLNYLNDRALGDVFQFVLVTQKKSFIEENHIVMMDLLRDGKKAPSRCAVEMVNATSKVFYSIDGQYSEAQSQTVMNSALLNIKRHISACYVIPAWCSAVRFDPCEDYASIISDFKVTCGSEKLVPVCVNGFSIMDHFVFLTSDPQFNIALPDTGQETQLRIDYDLLLVADEEKQYVQLCRDAIQQSMEAEQKLTRMEAELEKCNEALHDQVISTVFYSEDGNYSLDKAHQATSRFSVRRGEAVNVSIDVFIPSGMKYIAIDPCEGCPCTVYDLHVIWQGKELGYRPLTGFQVNDVLFFHIDDPRIECELPDGAGGATHIDFKMRLYGVRDRSFGIFEDRLKKLNALIAEKEELDQMYAQVKSQYGELIGALLDE